MERYLETSVPSFDGHRLWARSIGWGKPALVLCDGLGCDGYVWKYLIPHFERRHRIIHWNYRGHGKTAVPENIETLCIEDFARDLEQIIEHFQLKEPPLLLGHSMGVQVILEFAHRFRSRALGLVAITGSYGRALDHVHDAGWPKEVYPLLKSAFDRLEPLGRVFWKNFFTSELAYLYAVTFEINGRLIKREDFFPYLEHLAHMDPRIFMLTLEAAARHTAEPYLPEIDLPTLIIAAERDRFTPFWIGQRMQSLMPQARLVKLPMCSHTGPLEMPELTNLSIEKFLEELPRRAGRRRRSSAHE